MYLVFTRIGEHVLFVNSYTSKREAVDTVYNYMIDMPENETWYKFLPILDI